MRSTIVTTALVLAAGALYFVGCTDTNQLPTAPPEFNEGRVPSPRERIQERAPQARINALIREAFSSKADRKNAQKQMARIKNALARGDLAEGQALTFVFMEFVRENADDIDAAADLTAELMAFAQISGTAGVVGSAGGDLVSPDERAAVSIPQGALSGDELISFFKKNQPCFPVSDIPTDEQFDDCYTYQPEGLQFEVPVRFEVCLDLAVTDGNFDPARLHGRDAPDAPEVLKIEQDLLINCVFPLASIGSSGLERFARAGLNRLIGLFGPQPLLAANALLAPKRLGGTRGSFTDIGWALPQGEPDLIIESLTHSPANPTTVDLITFTAVVKNIGTLPAGASTLRFTIGGETPGEATDFAVPLLAPGADFSVERQLVLNVAQNYGTTAIADFLDDVAESNEANNQETDLFTVTLPPPDLIIESLTHSPASPTTVDLITFTAVVKNIGTLPAGASTLMFKIGGETPGAPSTRFPVPALAPGATFTAQRQLSLVAQGYINTAEADFDDDVAELDEGNNQALDAFVVTPGVIDFESLPGGAPLVQDDLPVALTNEFGIVGVVFSYTPTLDLPPGSPRICNSTVQDPPWVPANNHSVSWPSPDPNCYGGVLGTITMDFPGLPSEVRFLMRRRVGAPAGPPTITAVDQFGSSSALSTVLSTPASYTDGGGFAWQEQTVTVTTGPSSGRIARIDIYWPGGGGVLLVDDLEIDP